MAEPISLASGLLTLATFAFQSSVTLHRTIQSFQNHPKRVRDLEQELEALSGVLHTLTDTVSGTLDVDLSSLELPLLRCGKACEEFEQELAKCSARSGGNRTSFRDWAKLMYMGDNIDDFRQLLAGYRATINIALAHASFRKSSITAQSLESYRDLIRNATDDLEARLEAIDEKIEIVFARNATQAETAELRRIKEERLSTQKCLLICAQLSAHIDQIQPRLTSYGEGLTENSEESSEAITSKGIQECRSSLDYTTAKLHNHMLALIDQLMTKSENAMAQGETADLIRLREDLATTRQCIDICSRADRHLKENITVIDNHATGDDTIQFLVSTREKTIHGKNQGDGFRIRQVGGHLSDESVQQLSRDLSRISLPSASCKNEDAHGGEIADPNDSVKDKPRPGHQLDRDDGKSPRPNLDSKKVPKSEETKQNSSQKRSVT